MDEFSLATKTILKELKEQPEFLFTFKMDVVELLANFNDILDTIHAVVMILCYSIMCVSL